jgi:hypothetical protein
MLYYSDTIELSDHDILNQLKQSTCKYIDDKSPDHLTIIGFDKVIIKKLIITCHVTIISNCISLEDGIILDFSNTIQPRTRKHSVSTNLPGLPGLPGYNLTIISPNFNPDLFQYTFISNGSSGGPGTSPGKNGTPGSISIYDHYNLSKYIQIAYMGINMYENTKPEIVEKIRNLFDIR